MKHQADGQGAAVGLAGEHGVVDGADLVVMVLVQDGAEQAADPARGVVARMAVTGFAVAVLRVLAVRVLAATVAVAGCRAAGGHDSGTGPAAGDDSTGTVADQRSSTLPTRQ
jgi:hypothetical protein